MTVPTLTREHASETIPQIRLIDINGTLIPSIFHGAVPNPKVALENSKILNRKGANPGSCAVVNLVYRKSDTTAKFLNVQDAGCSGYWQYDYFRVCIYCGGQDDTTFTDSSIEPDYCIGYAIAYDGCDTRNCRDQHTCYNNTSPGATEDPKVGQNRKLEDP